MERLTMLLSCIGLGILPAMALAQTSNAARWLVGEALATYCQGAGGTFAPGGLVETDLTGDGQDDLLIYTGALNCNKDLPACGAIYCDATLYVREGDLLVERAGILTQCAEVVPGNPPRIRLCHRSDGPYTVHWNGSEFTE